MLDVLDTRVRATADGEEIIPGVRALAAHGHTGGHTGFVIADGGRRLIAFADALHSPLQIGHPEFSAVVDYDPAVAAAVRQRLVDGLAWPGRPRWHALDG